MTSRKLDTRIRINSNSTIESLYSNSQYNITKEGIELDYDAILENENYVFYIGKIAYKVSLRDVQILGSVGRI